MGKAVASNFAAETNYQLVKIELFEAGRSIAVRLKSLKAPCHLNGEKCRDSWQAGHSLLLSLARRSSPHKEPLAARRV